MFHASRDHYHAPYLPAPLACSACGLRCSLQPDRGVSSAEPEQTPLTLRCGQVSADLNLASAPELRVRATPRRTSVRAPLQPLQSQGLNRRGGSRREPHYHAHTPNHT